MTNSFKFIFSFLAALCAAASVHSLLSWLFTRPPSIAIPCRISPFPLKEPST